MKKQFDYACDVRPMPGEELSGDCCLVRVDGDRLMAVLVDVLGHGPEAGELAGDIRTWLTKQETSQPVRMIEAMHEQFRGSRGCVASILLWDRERGILSYSGIGNIMTRIAGKRIRQLVNRDGVIGYRMVRPVEWTEPITAGDIVLMHSDGLSSRLDERVFGEGAKLSSAEIVKRLMTHQAKQSDDASCIAIQTT